MSNALITLGDYIKAIETAQNMIVVEGILCAVTRSFMEKYSQYIQAVPEAKTGLQTQWIADATSYYKDDILALKNKLIPHIPVRFHKTEMYKSITQKLSK